MRSPHQLQVERRESHRANQVYALHTPATGSEMESRERLEPIKCIRSPHTSYRLERRESHRDNQVMAHHTPATGGEERES